MKHFCRVTFWLFVSVLFTQSSLLGQSASEGNMLPCSLEIHWKAITDSYHVHDIQKLSFRGIWDDILEGYGSKQPYVVNTPHKVKQVWETVSTKVPAEVLMNDFGIDPKTVKENASDIWNTCTNYFDWDTYYRRFSNNRWQQEYFAETFSTAENLGNTLMLILGNDYIRRNEYKVIAHWAGGRKDTLLSGRDFWAHYLFPYVKDVWAEAEGFHTPQGDKLYRRMFELYMLEHNGKLHELGHHDIINDIKELENSFEVVEAGLLMDYGQGGGVYVKNDVPAYYAMLRRKGMPENMDFRFVFEKRDGKVPSFEDVKSNFDKLVERVAQTPFFNELLQEGGYERISISYVNGSTLSPWQIKEIKETTPKKIRNENPDLMELLISGNAIHVDAAKKWDNTDTGPKGPGYLVHRFLLFPGGEIIACHTGNRIIPATKFRLTDKSTWKANSGGLIWLVPAYDTYKDAKVYN